MSKWASNKNQKMLFENWRKYVNEDASAAQVDPRRFPKELSKVNMKLARKYTRSGVADVDKKKDDDVINVSPTGDEGFPVRSLKPSQSSMNIKKAMRFAVQMLHPEGKLRPGGDLGAFISKEGYIMDGHHRWIATGMVNPDLKVGGYHVDFPAEQLIAVLNAITKGRLGIPKGKSASGGFDQFTEENIRAHLTDMAQKGHPWGNLSAEQVVQGLEEYSGQEGEAAIEATVAKLTNNLGQLTLSAPGFAPEREDMPVIDKDQVAKALEITVKALQQGEVDVNPPYGAGGGRAHGQEAGTGKKMDWEAAKEETGGVEEEEPLKKAAEALRRAGRLLERAERRHATKKDK